MKKGKGFLIASIIFFILATITSLASAGVFGSGFMNIFTHTWNSAASVGVIGGADGPTAIFVTSKFSYMAILSLAFKICCLVSFIIWIIKNKKAD